MRRIALLLLLSASAAAEEDVATLARQLASGKAYERWEACEALRELGPAAKEAVPALIEALKDEHVCADAAMALRRIAPHDERVVKALVAALDTAPLHHRREVVRALADEPFQPAVPWLLKEIRTNAHGSADRATGWLMKLTGATVKQVGALVSEFDRDRSGALQNVPRPAGLAAALLADPSPAVRVAAARILEDVEGSGPILIRALPEPNFDVDRAVRTALYQRAPGWESALTDDYPRDGIVLRLEAGSARVLLAAHARDAEALEDMARAVVARLATPPDAHLLQALGGDSDRHVRRCAALLLGYMARDREAAARALKDLDTEDAKLRALATASRVRLLKGLVVADPEEQIEGLGRQLANKRVYRRWEACEALRKLGPAAKEAVPALIDALKDEHVCADAAMALRCIAPHDERVIKALVAALDTAPLHHRREVVRALGEAPFHPAIPWLIEEMRTNAHGSADRARRWLAEILDTTEEGVVGLASDNHRMREAVVQDRYAHPELAVAMLRDPHPFVRRVAARVLQPYEGMGPLLARAMADEDPSTADVIRVALHSRSAGWASVLRSDAGKGGTLVLRLDPNSAARLLADHARDIGVFDAIAAAAAATLTKTPDEHLRAALKHEDARVRRCAALLLGYVARDKAAARETLEGLKDDDALVRGYAEASLERLAAK